MTNVVALVVIASSCIVSSRRSHVPHLQQSWDMQMIADDGLGALTALLLAQSLSGEQLAGRAKRHTMRDDRSNRLRQLTRISRRCLLFSPLLVPTFANAEELKFSTASSGLQWANAKEGTGEPFVKGQRVTIDYVMSTTGARYGTKIDSTKDRQEPYSWVLGDGSTIAGLEQAILGTDGVEAMRPGGVRRIIVPSSLAYADLAIPKKNNLQWEGCTGKGPIPPNAPQTSVDMGAGEFQRFKNIYCNANRPYQPDLVMDIKLYGKRN